MKTLNGICLAAALAMLPNLLLADELDRPDVAGIIGMAPVPPGSCVAVYVPVPEGSALTGVVWYNNDLNIVFPEILVASGVAGAPEPIADALCVATAVSGISSGWSEVSFSEPVAAIGDGYYVVFRLPEGSEHTANGQGGGAGIGYHVGANGHSGWLSLDGEEWTKLHDDFGMAIDVLIVEAEDDMAVKSLDEPQAAPVEHTAFLAPAPNPFNPQTELRFQLKDEEHVTLSIFNVKGERVIQLLAENMPAGRHRVAWHGVDAGGHRLASGSYFARFQAGSLVQTQRLLLVK